MSRIAHCCCGTLRAEVTGDPALVAACHCIACQRRTGAAFGVSAYFFKDQVRIDGPDKVYGRRSDAGRKVEFHFCPDCGSTVFWYAEYDSSLIGIALGTFADPLMPRPTISAWETSGHPWVMFGHKVHHLSHQEPPQSKAGE